MDIAGAWALWMITGMAMCGITAFQWIDGRPGKGRVVLTVATAVWLSPVLIRAWLMVLAS